MHTKPNSDVNQMTTCYHLMRDLRDTVSKFRHLNGNAGVFEMSNGIRMLEVKHCGEYMATPGAIGLMTQWDANLNEAHEKNDRILDGSSLGMRVSGRDINLAMYRAGMSGGGDTRESRFDYAMVWTIAREAAGNMHWYVKKVIPSACVKKLARDLEGMDSGEH